MVYVLLADGFEEVEALAPADLLRRAGVEAKLVGVTGDAVKSSHGITVQTDLPLEAADWERADMVVLPGGMPGAANLYADERVRSAVQRCCATEKYVAAICAAPSVVLGAMGLLNGRKATCYPGMEDGMKGATAVDSPCVTDGHIITARGVGAALDFACALISALCGEEKARQIAASVVYNVR